MRKSFTRIVYPCFQCGYKFDYVSLAFHGLFFPEIKTVTCPQCGVEVPVYVSRAV